MAKMKTKKDKTHRDIERKDLGLNYLTEDELEPVEKHDLIKASAPVKEIMHRVVETKPYEPFGAPGITDSTKYDGNLADQLKEK